MKAVIDRFEEDLAVLLIGSEERKMIVSRTLLPEGAHEGHWLDVEMEEERLIKAKIDEDETRKVRRRIESKVERLRRRRRDK